MKNKSTKAELFREISYLRGVIAELGNQIMVLTQYQRRYCRRNRKKDAGGES